MEMEDTAGQILKGESVKEFRRHRKVIIIIYWEKTEDLLQARSERSNQAKLIKPQNKIRNVISVAISTNRRSP